MQKLVQLQAYLPTPLDPHARMACRFTVLQVQMALPAWLFLAVNVKPHSISTVSSQLDAKETDAVALAFLNQKHGHLVLWSWISFHLVIWPITFPPFWFCS